MADETRISELLTELNQQMGEYTPYKLAFVDPKELRPVEKNAHFMSKRVFDQLVDNIKTDKNLSTLPFCWQKSDGTFIVLSGNHRVQAAVQAGVSRILVLYTDQALSRASQIGIQLSHNSLVGQDNPTVLIDLWNEIDDLRFKIYSGLDDNFLKTIQPVSILRLNEEPLRLEELSVLFIPAELARMEEVIKRLGSVSRKRFAALASEYDKFFDTLLTFKESQGIVNTATAFLQLADIADEWMANNAKNNEEIEHKETEQ